MILKLQRRVIICKTKQKKTKPWSVLSRPVLSDSVTTWTVTHQSPLIMGILQAKILEWVAMPSSMGIFSTTGSNPGLPQCRQILYQLRYQGSPPPHPSATNQEKKIPAILKYLLSPLRKNNYIRLSSSVIFFKLLIDGMLMFHCTHCSPQTKSDSVLLTVWESQKGGIDPYGYPS